MEELERLGATGVRDHRLGRDAKKQLATIILGTWCTVKEVAIHSGTSDKGPSEIGTTTLQRRLVVAPC